MQTPKNRVIHHKCGEKRVVHPLKTKNVDKLRKLTLDALQKFIKIF